LISSLHQKELGSLTSTLNYTWNLEFAKKITGGNISLEKQCIYCKPKCKKEPEVKSKNQKLRNKIEKQKPKAKQKRYFELKQNPMTCKI
jgi:hypothetical protein